MIRVAARWTLFGVGVCAAVLLAARPAHASVDSVTFTGSSTTTGSTLTWSFTATTTGTTTCAVTSGATTVAGPQTCTGGYSYAATAAGSYTLTVTDDAAAAGDAAASASDTVVVTDPAPLPAPAVPSPTAAASPATDTSPTWQLGLPAGTTGSCTLIGPDGAALVQDVDCGAGPSWTYDLGAGAASGDYTLHVAAVGDGVTTSGTSATVAAAPYQLDLLPPGAVTVTAPASPSNSTSATFSITESGEAAAAWTCTLTEPDGSDVAIDTGCGPGTLTVATPNQGDYTLKVVAADALGNTTSARDTYTVDLTAPADPTVTPAKATGSSLTATFAISGATGSVSCAVSGPAPARVSSCTATSVTIVIDSASPVDGDYVVTVTATDAAGNSSGTVTAVYTLDRVKPAAVTVAAPASPAQDPTPTFTVTEPDAGLTYDCTVTGPNGYSEAVAGCAAGDVTVAALPADGTYRLTVTVTDAAGNSVSGYAEYTLDTTGPGAVTVTRAKNPDSDRNPSFTVSATDSGTLSYACTVNGSTALVQTCGATTTLDLATAADGDYVLQVTVTDAAGNSTGPVSFTYHLDTTGPVAAPAAASAPDPRDNLRSVTWTFTANEPGESLRCPVAGPAGATVTCSGMSVTLTITGGDGTYGFTVTTLDALGNPGATVDLSYVLDVTGPAKPVASTVKTPGNTNPVSWQLTVTETGETYTCSVSPAATVTCAADGTATLTAPTDGTYTVTVTPVDAYGNAGTPVTLTYTLDTQPPAAFTVSRAKNPDNDRSPSFTVSATDSGPLSYACTVNGSTALVQTCGPTTTLNLTGAADGDYVLQVTVTDAAGNSTGPVSFTYHLDTTGPAAAPAVASAPDPTDNVRSVTWTFTANEPGESLACGPAPTGATVSCSGMTVTMTITGSDGTYGFTVTALDALGNPGATVDLSYVLDVTGPAKPTASTVKTPGSTNPVSWTISRGETGETYTCTVDDSSASVTCTGGTVVLSMTTDGTYHVTLTPVDAYGNEGTPLVLTYGLDTTAPAAFTVTRSKNPDNVRNPSFTVSATDSGPLTYACTVNGSAALVQTCGPTTTLNLTGASDGDYLLKVTVTDAAGNSTGPVSFTYHLDTTGPAAAPAVASAPDPTDNVRSVTWTFTADEPGESLSCATSPAGATVTCSGMSVTLTITGGDGTYAFSVTTVDVLGNAGATVDLSYVLDVTGPAKPTASTVKTPGNTNPVSWTLSGGEAGETYTCTVSPVATVTCAPDGTVTLTAPADGTYTVTVTPVDAYGNAGTPVTLTYTLDTRPPAAFTVTRAKNPDNDRSPSFTVSATDSGPLTYTCTVNGSTALVQTCGPTTTLNLTGAADGDYLLKVTVTDAAGNSTGPVSFTYHLDTTPPTAVVVSAPASPSRFKTVTFTITEPDTDPLTFACTLTNTTTGAVTHPTCAAGDLTLTLPADGVYRLDVLVTDAAGNSTSGSASYTYDGTPPSSFTIQRTPSIDNDTTPVFTVTETDTDVTYACDVDGHGEKAVILACGTTTKLDLSSLGDGVHVLTVVASDPVGNTTTRTFTYTLDTRPPPAPQVTGPSDPTKLTVVPVTITDTESGLAFSCVLTTPDGSGPAFATCPAQIDTTSYGDGRYTLVVTATDQAGNTTSTTISWTRDTKAPPAPSVSPPAPLTNSRSVTLTISDTEAGVRLTCVLTGPGGTVVNGPCPAGGTFDTTGSGDGVYTLVVTATDAAGNSASTTVSWTRDTQPPPVPSVSPPAKSPAQTRNPTFGVSDSETGVTYTCTVAGPASVPVSCGASAVLNLTGAPDGTYTLSVTATDAAGNVSAAGSASFVLDSTPPAAPQVTVTPSPSQGRHPGYTISGVEPGGVLACTLTGPAGSGVTVAAACSTSIALDLTGQPDGSYTLSVTVTDSAGNVSSAGVASYVLDTTAPATPTVTPPTSPENDATPTMTIAGEPGATATCTIARFFQTVRVQRCSDGGTLDLTGLQDGEFEVTVVLTDAAGNVSSPVTVTFVLDTVAPATPGLTVPASPSPVTRPVWLWTAEADSTATCTVTNAVGAVVQGPVACTDTFTGSFGSLPDGTYTLAVVVTDAAGNSAPAATSMFILDRQAPVPPTVVPPPSPGSTTKPVWQISAPRRAVLTCTLTHGRSVIFGPAACPGNGTFSLAGQPDGTYTLTVIATDSAGNVSAASVTTYVLDRSAPRAPRLDYASPSPSTSTSPYWGFTLPDGTTGRCQLLRDGNVLETTRCAGAVTFDLSGRPAGTYDVLIVAIDDAGNVSEPLRASYVLGHASPPPPPPSAGGGPFPPTGLGGGHDGPGRPGGGAGGVDPVTPPTGVVQQAIDRLTRLGGSVRDVTHKVVDSAAQAAGVLPAFRDRFTENVTSAVQGVVDAVSHAGGGAGFPLLLLVVVLGFLLVQNRIDRRDPKLALASVAADDMVQFLPPPSRGGA